MDKTPGLTRDRREGISKLNSFDINLANLFDIPIRVVDTAGFESPLKVDDSLLKSRSLNKQMLRDMLLQTRNALIYSDLALFLLDTRNGITYNDVALFEWLHYHKLKLNFEKTK